MNMSLSEIPDFDPKIGIDREDAINLLLASIAQEELGLAHIISAEGEKIKVGLEKTTCIDELLALNRSVEQILRNVIKKEMLLLFKLSDVLELIELNGECKEK
jgi:hypothetical protein